MNFNAANFQRLSQQETAEDGMAGLQNNSGLWIDDVHLSVCLSTFGLLG